MKVSVAEWLVSLELRLHDPEVRRSSANLAALLADGFVEFGSSGRVYTKSEIVAALVAETPTDIRADDFVAKELAPGVALLTYEPPPMVSRLCAAPSGSKARTVGRWCSIKEHPPRSETGPGWLHRCGLLRVTQLPDPVAFQTPL